MGKICAVPGCQSGRNSQRMKRKSEGLRQLTLFSVPRNEERRSEWKNILGCDLDVTQRVCQLHFAPESIKKTDKTQLANGSIHEIPRNLWYLDFNAIPTREIHPALDKEVKPATNAIGKSKISESLKNSTKNYTADKLVEEKSKIVEPKASKSCSPCLANESNEEIDWHENQNSKTVFTMEILKDQLGAAILPESWAWTQLSSGIIFTFLDRCNFQPQLHLEVALNLSMQIRTCTNTVIPLKDTAASMGDIRGYLETLKSRSICTGTGIEVESRDRRCMGILDDDEVYARQQRHPRCMLCRILRKKLQKYSYRRRDAKMLRKIIEMHAKSESREEMKENIVKS